MNMPVLKPIPFPKNMGMLELLTKYTRKWEIYEDYLLDIPGHPTIVIPKGFVYDGASIPKIFRNLISPVGCLLIPGTVHDFGYFYNTLLCIKDGVVNTYMWGAGKDTFDSLFLEIADYANGIHKINKMAYFSVKYFGGSAWESHKDTQALSK